MHKSYDCNLLSIYRWIYRITTIFAVVAGTVHTLVNSATYSGGNPAQGDKFRLSVTGNTLTVTSTGATSTINFTDSNNYVPSGGYAGFALNDSSVITGVQTGLFAFGANQCATPTFSPVAGSYGPTQTVTVTSATSGCTIYYTTDGTTPTESSSSIANGGTVSVASSLTLKAIASLTDNLDSAVGSATYTINGALTTPSFSPVAGTYSSTQSVTITSNGIGEAIYYTTDGSTPTSGSTLYTGPVSVSSSLTLKAIAILAGWSNSAVGSAAYVISSTYSISGNAGVAGATVSYTGTASGSVTADGSGNYTITGLANGSYTITPTKTGYTFSPSSSPETVSGSNITGVNFTATLLLLLATAVSDSVSN